MAFNLDLASNSHFKSRFRLPFERQPDAIAHAEQLTG
jgi:hypothetical protein